MGRTKKKYAIRIQGLPAIHDVMVEVAGRKAGESRGVSSERERAEQSGSGTSERRPSRPEELRKPEDVREDHQRRLDLKKPTSDGLNVDADYDDEEGHPKINLPEELLTATMGGEDHAKRRRLQSTTDPIYYLHYTLGINAQAAWDMFDNPGITDYSCGTALEPSVVAIFDTGFDRFHEDLPAKVVWRNALGREGLIVYKYNLKY